MKWTEIPRIELGSGISGRIIAMPVAKDRGFAKDIIKNIPVDDDFYKKHQARVVEYEKMIFVLVGVEDEKDSKIFGAVAWKAIENFLGPVKFHLIPDFLNKKDALEGALLASYRFGKYKKNIEDRPWIVFHGTEDELREVIAKVRAVFIARDIANEPSNELYPEKLAEIVRDIFAGTDVEVEVYTSNWLEEKGFGGVLAVGKGSINKPRLIIMKYLPVEGKKPYLLVGKGVCYDAGGINLKPTGYLEDMKMDVSGGGNVIGIMWALQALKAKVNVIGIVPAVENMPGANAVKPGDVIKMYNGKTVEVQNTDAEGRLILADSLAYGIERFEPEAVLDMATLTGACVVALGETVAGAFGKDELVKEIIDIGKKTGEDFWQLPLFEDYMQYLQSDVADIRNCAERSYAGASVAALFLKQFVDTENWVHLDIAGPAISKKPWKWHNKGGTGFATRTVLEWLLSKQ